MVVASLGTVSNALTIPSAIESDASEAKDTGTWTNILTTGYHQGNSGGGCPPARRCPWGIINKEMGGPLEAAAWWST